MKREKPPRLKETDAGTPYPLTSCTSLSSLLGLLRVFLSMMCKFCSREETIHITLTKRYTASITKSAWIQGIQYPNISSAVSNYMNISSLLYPEVLPTS